MKPAYRRPLIRKRKFGIPTVHPDACEFGRTNDSGDRPGHPGSRESPFGTHAALRHNEGHSLIEPSDSSRACAVPHEACRFYRQLCMRSTQGVQPHAQRCKGCPDACLSGVSLLQFAACTPALFSPDGLPQLVRDLRPCRAAVLKLPIAHGGELTPGAGPFAPDTDDFSQAAPDRYDDRRPGRATPVGGRDHPQSGQLAALTGVCGNGPSAFSVRIESQYSRISLILPSSIRKTRQ